MEGVKLVEHMCPDYVFVLAPFQILYVNIYSEYQSLVIVL